MKCYIPTFEASREGQKYVRVISVRVRADLSLNLANFNINGFFSTDAHQNASNVLLFVLKWPIFGYITLHRLIYQESFKKNFWFYVTSACMVTKPRLTLSLPLFTNRDVFFFKLYLKKKPIGSHMQS